MPYSGLDFYNRLSNVCRENGTSITSFLVSLGKSQSAGTYMKTKKTPDAKIVAAAANTFNVPEEYLLGLSDFQNTARPKNQYYLDDEEAGLIDSFRSADKNTKKSVLKMAHALLDAPSDGEKKLERARTNSTAFAAARSFSSAKGNKISHFRPEEGLKHVEGRAAAGLPLEAEPENDETMSVPSKYLSDEYFIVKADGDSMIGANIDDGDYCVFQRDAYPDDGLVMFVQVPGDTDQPGKLIKRVFFHPESNAVELRSENPSYAPIFYSMDDVSIMGILAAVYSH